MKGIRVTGTGILALAGIGAAILLVRRVSQPVAAVVEAFNPLNPDNVISNTAESITGVNLYQFGNDLGGWIFELTHPRNI